MTDEQIKEITLAMIEKGNLILNGESNEDMAKQLARFINTLKDETNGESNYDKDYEFELSD